MHLRKVVQYVNDAFSKSYAMLKYQFGLLPKRAGINSSICRNSTVKAEVEAFKFPLC